MNIVIIKSQGFDKQVTEIDETDEVFVILNGQKYQIHFDCLDAIGVSTGNKVYAVMAAGNEKMGLICNYPEWIEICPNCGDDRRGKGSLITKGKSFCSENCYEEWHDAILEKRQGDAVQIAP